MSDGREQERPAELGRWLEPGPTSDWDAELREQLIGELAQDGIDVAALGDRELVEQVSAWLLRRAEFSDSFTTFVTAFDGEGRPYIPEDLRGRVGGGRLPSPEEWEREVSAKGMFTHRSHGSCTSSAIYLSGCLRALGIPTRTVLVIPLFDASDPRQWELVRAGLREPSVRRAVMTGMRGLEGSWASHTFNEVWLGDRWWRLDYDELGVGSLRPERFGLSIHVATFHDWADARMPWTIGRRQTLGERDAVFSGANPYALLSVRDELGPCSTLELPEPEVLVARLIEFHWTDDPSLPEDVRRGIESRGRFGLIARIAGTASPAGLRELLATADLSVFLEAAGRSALETRLDAGCWWHLGEAALEYVPIGPEVRDGLAPGVEYRPRLPNESAEARIELDPGLILRRDGEPPPLSDTDAGARGVRGSVRDARGGPARAEVSAVFDHGSVSVRTEPDGRFSIPELPELPASGFLLHASTEDGWCALRANARLGGGVDLVLEPGATLEVRMTGREGVRCGLFLGELRIQDFTLRESRPAHFSVPPGELLVRLYQGSEVLAERTLSNRAGDRRELHIELP